jgi:hypothetical protein
MKVEDYAGLMKAVLNQQIKYVEEEYNFEESEWLQGQKAGLEIAIMKIDQSAFLYEGR